MNYTDCYQFFRLNILKGLIINQKQMEKRVKPSSCCKECHFFRLTSGEIHQKLGHLYNGQIIAPVDWVLDIMNDIASKAFLINQNKKFYCDRLQILKLHIALAKQ